MNNINQNFVGQFNPMPQPAVSPAFVGSAMAPANTSRMSRVASLLQKAQPKNTPGATAQQGVVVSEKFPQAYRGAVEAAYKNSPTLPRGYLEALVHQESSLGKNRTNEKKDVGKYGWLVGFTESAASDLRRKRIPFNPDTPEGAIDAAAKYSALRQNIYNKEGKVIRTITDPRELYATRYATSAAHENAGNAFAGKLKLYTH